MSRVVLSLSVLAALILCAARVQAHKPITSKYTYTEDVFPIVSARCGECHTPGGVAPMSLLTYKDAFPWAESMRVELTAGHMPPWYAERAYGEVKDPARLSPRELDILMTWASGGTPQGPAKRLTVPPLKTDWKLGKPDLSIPMPSAFTLGADTMESTEEYVLQSTSTDRWVRAVDLLPGTPAIVRDATIFTRSSTNPETRILALWAPGDELSSTPAGSAFRWAAGTDLVLRIHYLKTWTYDGKALSDRSTVGLYFLNTPSPTEVQAVSISSPSITLDRDDTVLALRFESKSSDAKVHVDATRPDGSRVPLIGVTARPGWNRRYWLSRPLALPRGTRISLTGDKQVSVFLEVTQ